MLHLAMRIAGLLLRQRVKLKRAEWACLLGQPLLRSVTFSFPAAEAFNHPEVQPETDHNNNIDPKPPKAHKDAEPHMVPLMRQCEIGDTYFVGPREVALSVWARR